MHSLLNLRTYLLPLALLTTGIQVELLAQSQSSAPANSPFDLLQKKWTLMPTEELLKAAQSNDAQAQYFYWRREFEQGTQEANRLDAEREVWRYTLSPDKQESLWSRWKNATDEAVTQAVERGDVEAKIILNYRKASAAVEHADKAFPFLEKSAEQGFPPAEGEAALYYLNLAGWVMGHTNRPMGLILMRRSADHGWANAQYQLANIYLKGEIVPPDIAKAVEYFQKAADQDGPRSQYELAMLYANGYGVPRDIGEEPVALLRKAAAKNNVPALHELAERYRIGLGVTLDYVQAAHYYQKTSQVSQNGGNDPEGIGEAILELVDSNLAPKSGLTRELAPCAKVVGVYLKATQQHDATAMTQIGEWYLAGRFVPKDMVEAFRWFRLAADFGGADAQKREDEIKAMLSPSQLEQALKTPIEQ
jgi:TPR repeat protein